MIIVWLFKNRPTTSFKAFEDCVCIVQSIQRFSRSLFAVCCYHCCYCLLFVVCCYFCKILLFVVIIVYCMFSKKSKIQIIILDNAQHLTIINNSKQHHSKTTTIIHNKDNYNNDIGLFSVIFFLFVVVGCFWCWSFIFHVFWSPKQLVDKIITRSTTITTITTTTSNNNEHPTATTNNTNKQTTVNDYSSINNNSNNDNNNNKIKKQTTTATSTQLDGKQKHNQDLRKH